MAASGSRRAAPTAIFPERTGRGRAGGGKSAGPAGRMCRPRRRREEAMLAPFCLRSRPGLLPHGRGRGRAGGAAASAERRDPPRSAALPPRPPSRSGIRGASLCSAAMMLGRLSLSAPLRRVVPLRRAGMERRRRRGATRCPTERTARASPRAIAAAPRFRKVAAVPRVSSRLPPPEEGRSSPSSLPAARCGRTRAPRGASGPFRGELSHAGSADHAAPAPSRCRSFIPGRDGRTGGL